MLELTGSEKQIKWANDLRSKWVDHFNIYMSGSNVALADTNFEWFREFLMEIFEEYINEDITEDDMKRFKKMRKRFDRNNRLLEKIKSVTDISFLTETYEHILNTKDSKWWIDNRGSLAVGDMTDVLLIEWAEI